MAAEQKTDGQRLIDAARAWLSRYIVVSPQQSLTLVLWAFHTWVYEQLSRTTPYLEVTGVSGSGKTALLEALAMLSRGPEILNTIRTMYICRRIEELQGRYTAFIDEAERLAHGQYGDQRSMLASGYRAGALHGISHGEGTLQFRSFCPKAFTSTATLTPVLHNRCIPIWLERARPTASLSLERQRAEATAAELIERFKALIQAQPRFITSAADWLTSERDYEIWTPLVSLARTLGCDAATMDELTAASVDLSALRGIVRKMDAKDEDENATERSYATRLLADAQAVLTDYNEPNVLSRVLIERLRAIAVGPWRAYNRTGLTETTLAQLLGAFGITSTTVQVGRRPNRIVGKGYKVASIKAGK